jgi:hypothetical protein
MTESEQDLQCCVLKEYFPSDYTYHVEKMEVDPEDFRNFECTIRIKALVGAVELCTRWLTDFSELTKTNWRNVKGDHYNPTSRFQFSGDLICNYGGCSIIEKVLYDRCAAHMKIRIKKYTSNVMQNDILAGRGFLTIIILSFYHNHLLLPTVSTFTNSYRPRDEITLMLLNYRRKGIDTNIYLQSIINQNCKIKVCLPKRQKFVTRNIWRNIQNKRRIASSRTRY